MDRSVLAQARIESVLVQFGKFIQQRLGLGLGGEDAAHGGQGEGAEADGTLQGRQHIVTLVMRHQRQQLLGLQLALDLLGEQAVEELHRDRAQLAEALPQQQGPLARIVGGMMALDGLPHAALRAGHEPMPGDLLQADRVDDDFVRR